MGVNLTWIPQEAPGASVVPQVLVWEKSPVILMELMAKAASPVFVRVAVWVLLVCTTCGAKFKVEVSPATGAMPVPFSATFGAAGAELLSMLRLPVRVKRTVGLNVTLIVQAAPGAREAVQVLI